MGIIIFLFYQMFIAALIIITLPLMAMVSLSIVLNSGFPIVYKQARVGKSGRKFILYKFRTMTPDADRVKPKLKNLNEADGPVFKIRNDPRFTHIGRFLSHTGLDELPQLINVLKGEMALIGPRPLPVNETVKLAPWQKKRLIAKPGIVSPWILNGYHAQPFVVWMRSDIDYISRKNVLTDTILVSKTCGLLIRLFVAEVRATLGKKLHSPVA